MQVPEHPCEHQFCKEKPRKVGYSHKEMTYWTERHRTGPSTGADAGFPKTTNPQEDSSGKCTLAGKDG